MKHVQHSASTRPLAAALRRFHRDESATLSIEAVLVIPILIWAFLAIFTFFDVYRAKSTSLKANYSISDLMSRETGELTATYLAGVEDVFQYLTQSGEESWVRVSVVYCTEDCADESRELRRDWSKATDNRETFSDIDIMDHFEPIIPWIAENERLVIVETGVTYRPPFSANITGIGERDFVDIVMTRPRFAGQLCWDGEPPCD